MNCQIEEIRFFADNPKTDKTENPLCRFVSPSQNETEGKGTLYLLEEGMTRPGCLTGRRLDRQDFIEIGLFHHHDFCLDRRLIVPWGVFVHAYRLSGRSSGSPAVLLIYSSWIERKHSRIVSLSDPSYLPLEISEFQFCDFRPGGSKGQFMGICYV
jgi:hypothetical protein